MNSFDSKDIIFTEELNDLVEYIDSEGFSYIYILVDENTNKHCLPWLTGLLGNEIRTYSILEVPAGESSKELEICGSLWASLTEEEADRNAVFINLGGGMICDLGGFVASCYKRGIQFINVPTTYLAMVDAAIGGKCGIDFMGFKNQIGLFSLAKKTFIFSNFLQTLSQSELKSGFAESLKHGLVADKDLWNSLDLNSINLNTIHKSAQVKIDIVLKDPFDKHERKSLNFGHTIGHALESYFLEIGKPQAHGFCVAAGILGESFISMKIEKLSIEEFQEIEIKIDEIYNRLTFKLDSIPIIIDKMRNDKKNENGRINFTLLNGIGNTLINQTVAEDLIVEALTNCISE